MITLFKKKYQEPNLGLPSVNGYTYVDSPVENMFLEMINNIRASRKKPKFRNSAILKKIAWQRTTFWVNDNSGHKREMFKYWKPIKEYYEEEGLFYELTEFHEFQSNGALTDMLNNKKFLSLIIKDFLFFAISIKRDEKGNEYLCLLLAK